MCSLGQDGAPYFMRGTEKATGPMCRGELGAKNFPTESVERNVEIKDKVRSAHSSDKIVFFGYCCSFKDVGL